MVMARPCSQVAGIGLSLAPQHPGGWTISDGQSGDGSKPYTPGEHQHSW